MSSQLRTTKGQILVSVAAVALVAAAGWFLVIAPKKNEAKSLDTQIVAVENQIAVRKAELARPKADVKVRAADLFRLSKAMPNDTDMAGIMLDLDRIAAQNEITFRSITPGVRVTGTGYIVQPMGVIVEGRFGNVSRFLADVRTLVKVKKRRLDARGRLFAVDQVDFAEPDGEVKFPRVQASLTIDAFTFDAASAVPAQPGTTTPPTQTTPSDGTVAAGVTP